MQAAQKCAARNLLGNVGDAGVRRLRCRRVVEGKADARNGLQEEDEQQAGAEHIGELCAARNVLIEYLLRKVLHAGSMIEPVKDACTNAFAYRGAISCIFIHDSFLPNFSSAFPGLARSTGSTRIALAVFRP